jgi:hypothetical protein
MFSHSSEGLGTIGVSVNLQLQSAAFIAADVVKVFNPQSPQARAIFHLAIVVIVVMVVIFAVVVGIVLYALLRFPRWREGEPDPEQVEGNNTIEIVWTAIPLAIVSVLFVLSARTMGISDPAPPPKPDIVVIGHHRISSIAEAPRARLCCAPSWSALIRHYKPSLWTGRRGSGRFWAKGPLGVAFKTPIFRNILLTGPYFHDGSQETLWDVGSCQ